MTNGERFTLVPEVFLILVRGGEILLARRFQTGYEDGNYYMVAGHVEGRETMREAAAREAKEEAGIIIDPACLEHKLTMHRWCGNHERIGCYFLAPTWAGEAQNREPDKCDDMRWFPLTQLPSNTTPHIRVAVDCYVNGISYVDFGWEGRYHL
ncbi:MAG: NUDIX domain-containing protein [bacterium]|nr:NUDIX domain-containing protein [bacterium]MDZ4295814.1 NUDIX domain-containing protein [Patescibacteria group bacterium]